MSETTGTTLMSAGQYKDNRRNAYVVMFPVVGHSCNWTLVALGEWPLLLLFVLFCVYWVSKVVISRELHSIPQSPRWSCFRLFVAAVFQINIILFNPHFFMIIIYLFILKNTVIFINFYFISHSLWLMVSSSCARYVMFLFLSSFFSHVIYFILNLQYVLKFFSHLPQYLTVGLYWCYMFLNFAVVILFYIFSYSFYSCSSLGEHQVFAYVMVMWYSFSFPP